MDWLIEMILIFVIFVICITVLILKIAKKFDRKLSPYPVFGIAAGLGGLTAVGLAMYDILTPGGDLNGMLGQILLMVYIPTVIVMITGDIIVWHIAAKNKQKDGR